MTTIYHPPGKSEEVGATSSITQWVFRHLWKKYGEELHQRDFTMDFVFMTVGDADTPWHPQIFNPVTFEIDGGLVSAGTASLTRCRGTWVRSASVFSLIAVFAVYAAFFRVEGCPPGGDICSM